MNLAQTFKQSKQLIITAGMFAVATLAQAQSGPTLIDKIAVIVDDDVVMQSEVIERLDGIVARIRAGGGEVPPIEQITPQIVDRLIAERLQLSLGERMGVNVSEQEINQAVQRVAQSQQMTVDQLRARALAEGQTFQQLRNTIRNEMIISQVQQSRVMRRINISKSEIDNFLESEEGMMMTSPDVLMGHILLPVSSSADAEAIAAVQAKATDIAQRIRNGEDFKQMAILFSAGENALKGGDWGWRKVVQLPSIFIEPVNQLAVGEVTEPVRSGAGFHLLTIYDKRGATQQIIEQSKVRHILVTPNEIRDDAETEALLADLKQQIDDGADFAVLAKEHSEDPGSGLKGGELGWSTPGSFVPQFEETMNNIALNEVSKPFRSQFGWHILQVTERRNQDFSERVLENQASQILRNRKFEEELQVWLQEIRDEAFIQIKGQDDEEQANS